MLEAALDVEEDVGALVDDGVEVCDWLDELVIELEPFAIVFCNGSVVASLELAPVVGDSEQVKNLLFFLWILEELVQV